MNKGIRRLLAKVAIAAMVTLGALAPIRLVAQEGGTLAYRLVGTWQVLKYVNTDATGKVTYPFGENPSGYFIYDSTGHLSIQIMRTPAMKPFPGMQEGTGEADRYKEAFLSYVAYFGTYSVDAKKSTVTHHVEGSYRPDYTGTDQVRPFRIEGDRLIIEMDQGGQHFRRELLRVK